MLKILIVEDNPRLRQALQTGLEATRQVQAVYACGSGEAALDYCVQAAQFSGDLRGLLDGLLMDVQLEGELNGIQAAVAIRREFPRFPVVFYSIQDDDAYFRDFIKSNILSHYAYVRKSNYLLPEMVVPLLRDAVAGRGFIDPEIENRVHQVRQKDQADPLSLLEPNEQLVAHLMSQGLTNEQIAARMGYRDKRTISRVNGQIYAVWGLNRSTSDEKVARSRAIILMQAGRLMQWDEQGIPYTLDEYGQWVRWEA